MRISGYMPIRSGGIRVAVCVCKLRRCWLLLPRLPSSSCGTCRLRVARGTALHEGRRNSGSGTLLTQPPEVTCQLRLSCCWSLRYYAIGQDGCLISRQEALGRGRKTEESPGSLCRKSRHEEASKQVGGLQCLAASKGKLLQSARLVLPIALPARRPFSSFSSSEPRIRLLHIRTSQRCIGRARRAGKVGEKDTNQGSCSFSEPMAAAREGGRCSGQREQRQLCDHRPVTFAI